MSQNSRENREGARQELATELTKEQNPATVVRLAPQLNEALEKGQAASKKKEARENEPKA